MSSVLLTTNRDDSLYIPLLTRPARRCSIWLTDGLYRPLRVLRPRHRNTREGTDGNGNGRGNGDGDGISRTGPGAGPPSPPRGARGRSGRGPRRARPRPPV